ncbi:flagellar basal body-associated protein FliL [Rhodobium orientis]|uniref:Uncharacterized protein n=1 Tax=Rhodobium orientis TaxID=34017 RepID=A0A327JXB1_9HYPH|nr:hypothetical protein [Rhodobium orientis]MBB4300994.1 flagellar basal body-associated protein FliL [Rhodobium orientis]MBK5949661.1 hypothetical protein [Rhodobium orientis]RAI30214.1 hypothetical protein CH339_01440 [Rhodobium orientis]
MTELKERDAKQGRSGNRALIMLVAGLALAVIVAAGLMFSMDSIVDEAAVTNPGATAPVTEGNGV